MKSFREVYFSPYSQSGASVYVVETKPQKRTISVKSTPNRKDPSKLETNSFRLSFPYLQWTLYHVPSTGNRINVTPAIYLLLSATDQPLSSLTEEVRYIPLPNVSGMSVCLGDEWINIYAPITYECFEFKEDMARLAMIPVMSHFWQSDFLIEGDSYSPLYLLGKWQEGQIEPIGKTPFERYLKYLGNAGYNPNGTFFPLEEAANV